MVHRLIVPDGKFPERGTHAQTRLSKRARAIAGVIAGAIYE